MSELPGIEGPIPVQFLSITELRVPPTLRVLHEYRWMSVSVGRAFVQASRPSSTVACARRTPRRDAGLWLPSAETALTKND